MDHRYEVIDYSGTNFKFITGRTRHVTPHLHREFEIGVILDGTEQLTCADETSCVPQGEMWLLNPFENHEVHASGGDMFCGFVELQLSPAFFRDYFADIDRFRFSAHHLSASLIGEETLRLLREKLIAAALAYYEKRALYQLACASEINEIFRLLLSGVPYRVLDHSEEQSARQRIYRMQRINKIIEENYSGKLLLRDVADKEGLSLCYLSHFFRKNWGMSFQEYLQRYRCGRAAEMLTASDAAVADIAYACGFSDPRYMRQGFLKIYGMYPSDFRAEGTAPAAPPSGFRPAAEEYTCSGEEAIRVLQTSLECLRASSL